MLNKFKLLKIEYPDYDILHEVLIITFLNFLLDRY